MLTGMFVVLTDEEWFTQSNAEDAETGKKISHEMAPKDTKGNTNHERARVSDFLSSCLFASFRDLPHPCSPEGGPVFNFVLLLLGCRAPFYIVMSTRTVVFSFSGSGKMLHLY